MNKKIAIVVASAMLMSLPLLSFAQLDNNQLGTPATDASLNVTDIINIVLNLIWPLFIGFAVIMFLVAGFMFLVAQGDPAKIATARNAVLWGIVGVAMGVLAFSLPFIVKNTLGF